MSDPTPSTDTSPTDQSAPSTVVGDSSGPPALYPASSMLTDPAHFVSCAPGISLPSLSLASFSKHRVLPISPSNYSRRRRRQCGIPRGVTPLRIPPGRVQYPLYERQSQVGDCWEAIEHPEGLLYFTWNERRIYTEADMGNLDAAADIYLAIAAIDDFLTSHKIAWPVGDVDLVLDLYPDEYVYADSVCSHNSVECGFLDGECRSIEKYFKGACGYYFVHHETRAVFWFDDLPASTIPHCAWVPVEAAAHLRHAIQAQYWSHCAFFPDCRPCDRVLLAELHALVAHAHGDRIVYTQSAAGPWGREQLDRLLPLLSSLSDFGGAGLGCARIVFEFMAEHAIQRFVLFYGQPSVKFQANKSPYAAQEAYFSWPFHVARFLLFFVTDVYMRDLDELGRDAPLQNHEWIAFMEKAMTEWQEITLYNTVLLNANIALLTIQSVDTDGLERHTPLQMLSYASVMSSVCGLVIGILLLRRHRTKAVQDNIEALGYLASQYDENTGYGLLSIFYSLPFACLMYRYVVSRPLLFTRLIPIILSSSTLAFFSAFLFMGFQRCTPAQAGALAGLVVLMLAVIVWFLARTWRTPNAPRSMTVAARVVFVVKKARAFFLRLAGRAGTDSKFALRVPVKGSLFRRDGEA
ncbi:hypothetical protein BD626DRAFT_574327 [Schizophyllum amplum]|uniref:Transmembrane protein n=1 Tax=Schizophyllum amplum TaxID=97359 RepID=A0A550BYA8_9AGAR|nr:hypothetical protein BD626DRAFT_574327 [Auriculariopsis ampla]